MKGLVLAAMVYFAVWMLIVLATRLSQLVFLFAVLGGAMCGLILRAIDHGDAATIWYLPAPLVIVTLVGVSLLREKRRNEWDS